jgi:hypothetical protein
MGVGAFYSKSTAQKLNTTSSCHSEAVALDKCLQQSLFSQYVIEGQGYPTTPITIFQDNQSTIKLMENGSPTEFMIADIMTKPLQGSLFRTMRDRIMGAVPCHMVEG